MKQKPATLLIFGPPGVGKRTQGRMLCERHGWSYLSVNELFRDRGDAPETERRFVESRGRGRVAQNGGLTRQRPAEGGFLPADGAVKCVVVDELDDRVSKVPHLFGKSGPLVAVFLTGVTDQKLAARLSKRARRERRAEDTSPETLECRLDQFEESVASVILGSPSVRLLPVDARGRPEEVTARIEAALIAGGMPLERQPRHTNGERAIETRHRKRINLISRRLATD